MAFQRRQQLRRRPGGGGGGANHRHAVYATIRCFLAVCIGYTIGAAISQEETPTTTEEEMIDYGNHNLEWEDGPSSWDEFGHDNAPDICGLQVITVEEWEAGRYWEGKKPVIVKNVTEGWAALNNWKK
jgi:hypothetical protein